MADITPGLYTDLDGCQFLSCDQVPYMGSDTSEDGCHLLKGVAGSGDDAAV